MISSSIISSDLVSLNRRGLIQGLANICFGAGAALGGPLGGWFVDGLGWRWAFGGGLIKRIGVSWLFLQYKNAHQF